MFNRFQSDIYDSIGNSDVTFRRNGIDFMYFWNNQVDINTRITLVGEVTNTSSQAHILKKKTNSPTYETIFWNESRKICREN